MCWNWTREEERVLATRPRDPLVVTAVWPINICVEVVVAARRMGLEFWFPGKLKIKLHMSINIQLDPPIATR